jgi:Domain of unknown function (DUF309)
MINKHIQEFLCCLDEGRFYDAHEVLERLWFPRRFEDDPEIKLLKGYINASVSFELCKRGRGNSAKKVYNNYLKYKSLRLHLSSSNSEEYEIVEKKIEEIERRFHG